jgi:hypothetical protein
MRRSEQRPVNGTDERQVLSVVERGGEAEAGRVEWELVLAHREAV